MGFFQEGKPSTVPEQCTTNRVLRTFYQVLDMEQVHFQSSISSFLSKYRFPYRYLFLLYDQTNGNVSSRAALAEII